MVLSSGRVLIPICLQNVPRYTKVGRVAIWLAESHILELFSFAVHSRDSLENVRFYC